MITHDSTATRPRASDLAAIPQPTTTGSIVPYDPDFASRPFENPAGATRLLDFLDAADPLGDDAADDYATPTSLRRISRVAMVAAEAAARFTRDRLAIDPLAWMLAPRRLFGGAPAIVAVQNPLDFRRAMMLHGLSLGLDADPSGIDVLMDVEDGDDGNGDDRDCRAAAPVDAGAVGLFTASVVEMSSRGCLYVYHARVARSRLDFEDGLRVRLGAQLASEAVVVSGYDPSNPVAAGLLSGALEDVLVHVCDDPASPLASGLDIFVEHRFAS